MTESPEEYAARVEAAIAAALEELQQDLLPENVAQHEAADAFWVHGEDGRPIVRERTLEDGRVVREAVSNNLFVFDSEGGAKRAVRINPEVRDVRLDQAKRGDKEAARQLLAAEAYALRHILRPGDPGAAYAAEALASGIAVNPTRARQVKNAPRDLPIIMAVFQLARQHGFRPLRNAAAHGDPSKPHSACSIVVEALKRLPKPEHMSEVNVERLWKASGLAGSG